jgi:hypothetical protein
VGKGLMFISLDVGVLDALRAELEGRGVDVMDGQWGYRLMVIADQNGNQLYFPYPTLLAAGSLITSNLGHCYIDLVSERFTKASSLFMFHQICSRDKQSSTRAYHRRWCRS